MTDDEAMQLALDAARAAATLGEVPVGAVVLRGDEVLAVAANERETTGDPTAHAEIVALRAAAAVVGSWRLDGCRLIVTLEPCAMCAGAAINARLDEVVYGAADLKAGAMLSLYNLGDDPRLNHTLTVTPGVRSEECAAVLTEFFAARR